jgi:hypothetical protein
MVDTTSRGAQIYSAWLGWQVALAVAQGRLPGPGR